VILKLFIFIEVLILNNLVLFILKKQTQDTCSLYTPTPFDLATLTNVIMECT